MRVLSLFANIGVAEAYLSQIGVDVVVANELIERRAELYSKIYPNTQKHSFKVYNSIRNLQMLDANENESKGKKLLSDWVNENTTAETKTTFLVNHLIPDVDLSMANFDEYITTRSTLLKTKLKSILS